MTTPEAAVEFVLETIGRHRRGEALPGRSIVNAATETCLKAQG